MKSKANSNAVVMQEQYKKDAKALTPTALANKYKLTYDSWRSVKPRAKKNCIVLDQKFESFSSYLFWLGPRTAKNFTLDRIDPKGPYSPENCRWADKQTQTLNRTNAVTIQDEGEAIPVKVLANRLGVQPDVIYKRKASGWTDAEIVCGYRLTGGGNNNNQWPWPDGKEREWEETYKNHGNEDEIRESFLLRYTKLMLASLDQRLAPFKENYNVPTPAALLDEHKRVTALLQFAQGKIREKQQRKEQSFSDLF